MNHVLVFVGILYVFLVDFVEVKLGNQNQRTLLEAADFRTGTKIRARTHQEEYYNIRSTLGSSLTSSIDLLIIFKRLPSYMESASFI
jgi:hypothetical protein